MRRVKLPRVPGTSPEGMVPSPGPTAMTGSEKSVAPVASHPDPGQGGLGSMAKSGGSHGNQRATVVLAQLDDGSEPGHAVTFTPGNQAALLDIVRRTDAHVASTGGWRPYTFRTPED